MWESLRSLTKNERFERIAQVAHQKRATMSDSLRSLTKIEGPWAICSGLSPKMSEWPNRSFFWANRSFTNFFAKNKWFAQKTDERIPSPGNNWLKSNTNDRVLTVRLHSAIRLYSAVRLHCAVRLHSAYIISQSAESCSVVGPVPCR